MAAPSGRELTPSFARRYSNSADVPHGNFSQGMIRDIAPYLAPEGFCWNAVDLLCDTRGKIRKRGGYTSPAAGNSVASVENLAAFHSGGVDGILGLYGSLGKGAGGGAIQSFNRSTGAVTQLLAWGGSATGAFAARPFQHFNQVVFPFGAKGATANDFNGIFFAGSITNTAGFATTAATIVAGDNRITGIAPTSVAAGHLGSVIFLVTSTVGNIYIGRIVEILSTSSVRVEPTPQHGFTATASSFTGAHAFAWHNMGFFAGADDVVSGRFGVSYEGRIVLGYTTRTLGTAAADYVKGIDLQPNRIYWSKLSSEPLPVYGGWVLDGNAMLFPGTFTGDISPTVPYYNYLDVPGLEGMTGLAIAGEGNLVIFGPRKTFRVSGSLNTETQLNPNPDYTLSQISANVGCVSSRSIQYTRAGLIFAGPDNLYVYDGARMRPLLNDHNENYYQARLRAGDVIYGSAYALGQNHYYLSMSGTEGGLLFNLDSMQMTKMSNVLLFDAAPDPADATALWGARWWDTTGAAPTMTKGQLVALDPIWLPASTNTADADGTAIQAVFESKAYADGELLALKRFTSVKFNYDLRYGAGTATAAVSADTALNVSDASYVSVGTLPETGTTPGMKRFQTLPLLKKGQAIELKIVVGQCDSFELHAIETEVQQLRVGRST